MIMIKYVETKVVFQEVPDKISLAINISNCQHNCKGCHSPYLRTDTGNELNEESIERLISENKGINCVLFMGEGNDIESLMNMSKYIQNVVDYLSNKNTLVNLVQQSSFIDAMQTVMLQTWNVVSSTVNVALSVLGVFVVLLYMFFILVDYEKICQGWVNLIPAGKRNFASMVVQDVKNGMNAYFRGQSLIALIVGILFSIGFLIIDFPLAIGLGLFIGFLNLVPYMQLFGFIPTILLAILKATETGESFWFIMLCALAVFAVVQLIQDMYLTPRIMGHVMGLNPAIILLSLSIWGSLMGIIGLIIALPLTTLLLSYYRRFILKEVVAEAETEQKTEEDAQKSEENE